MTRSSSSSSTGSVADPALRQSPGLKSHRRSRLAGFISISIVVVTPWFEPEAAAQPGPTLHARDRVRLEFPTRSPSELIGRLIFLGPDTLTVRVRSRDLRIPLSAVGSIAVSRGIHPGLQFGAPILGAGVGALVGAAVLPESDRCRLAGDIADECDQILSNEVIGGAWGAVVFTLVASLIARERWVDVPLDLLLGANPRRRCFQVGVRVSW